jgi:hypothetical protein
MVAPTWITPGCVQFLETEKRFHTAWVNSGLMRRNKIRLIRDLVAAAEYRMRCHRIDRDRGFDSRRQA